MAKPKPLPSQEYLQSIFDYNPETGVLTWKERANAACFNSKYAGKEAGAVKLHGYLNLHLNGKNLSVHRIIWKLVTGVDADGIVDHINNNRADNRFSNLRVVSHLVNGQNKSKSKANTSGATGVYFEGGKWRAIFKTRGHKIHLGMFDNKDDAIQVRLEAELKDWSHLEIKRVSKQELTLEYLKENYEYDGIRLISTFTGLPLISLSESGYLRTKILGRAYLHHRLIYWMCSGIKPPENMIVDHKNGDKLDNRISNLRLITKAENNRNAAVSKNNKSGVTGVREQENSTWRAAIHHNGKTMTLGYFNTKEEATKARKEAELKYFGEHARQ